MVEEFDVCVIGSGAGGAPVAYELAKSGKKVCVIEKGHYFKRDEFSKDEIAYCRRNILNPSLKDEYHVAERWTDNGWSAHVGESFWNGSLVGGATNLMGGFFHRMHPKDFRLKSEFKDIEGANIVDWAISYDELEPYYTKVESIIGISGKVTPHPYEPPRSTKDFPYPPLKEHPITKKIDKTLKKMGINSLKQARCIISKDTKNRNACYYSNFCANYGCSSGAKGSSREALFENLKESRYLTIKPNSHALKLIEGRDKKITELLYMDKYEKKQKSIKAKIFVVACGAIESSRLLLNSKVANSSGEVGKNFIFGGLNTLAYGKIDTTVLAKEELMVRGYFIHRSVKDYYFFDDGKSRGGVIDMIFQHQNPIPRATAYKRKNNKPLWGEEYQKAIYHEIADKKQLNLEVFSDFYPHDNCFVTLDKTKKDRFGMPVAKIRISSHKESFEVAKKVLFKAKDILQNLGAKNIGIKISPNYPPKNLQAGGCRFGDDPKTTVLNRYCQSYDHKNLFVTDGSFMPTGGSVPFTWTIYANSFRVADFIKKEYSKLS